MPEFDLVRGLVTGLNIPVMLLAGHMDILCCSADRSVELEIQSRIASTLRAVFLLDKMAHPGFTTLAQH